MENLIVSDYMTLTLPDDAGDIGIDYDDGICMHYEEVSFKKLEKWVALISEQIETNDCDGCKYSSTTPKCCLPSLTPCPKLDCTKTKHLHYKAIEKLSSCPDCDEKL